MLRERKDIMNNKQKFDQAFIETFSIGERALNDELLYNTIPEWDSVGHMSLIAGLEEAFDIMMEMDDIIDFGSYKKGFELIGKYRVEFK